MNTRNSNCSSSQCLPNTTKMALIEYLAELGQQHCCQILYAKAQTACHVEPTINCWLATGSKNGDGYTQASILSFLFPYKLPANRSMQVWAKKNSTIAAGRTGRSSQTTFLLHIIAHVANCGQEPPVRHQISHLCIHRLCFKPDHLYTETPMANNNRKRCPRPLFCPDHGHKLSNLCRYQLQCIRPPCLELLCCLTIQKNPG